jgi:hypothetical protein
MTSIKVGQMCELLPGHGNADLSGLECCIVGVAKVDDAAGTALVLLPHRLPPRWIEQRYLLPYKRREEYAR